MIHCNIMEWRWFIALQLNAREKWSDKCVHTTNQRRIYDVARLTPSPQKKQPQPQQFCLLTFHRGEMPESYKGANK